MLGHRARKNILLISVLLFAAVLIYLAMLPKDTALHILKSKQNFSPAHMAAYFCFSLWFSFLVRYQRSLMGIRMTHLVTMMLTFVAAIILGAVTEIVQIYSLDRTPDIMDVLDDSKGASAGILFYAIAVSHKKWRYHSECLRKTFSHFFVLKSAKSKFPAH